MSSLRCSEIPTQAWDKGRGMEGKGKEGKGREGKGVITSVFVQRSSFNHKCK